MAAITSNESPEMDSLVKIWGEVFETMYPNCQQVRCKWYCIASIIQMFLLLINTYTNKYIQG